MDVLNSSQNQFEVLSIDIKDLQHQIDMLKKSNDEILNVCHL